MKYLLVILTIIITSCKHPNADEIKGAELPKLYLNTQKEYDLPHSYESSEDSDTSKKNILPMERIGGVSYVTIEINKIPLKFVFDTGASNICISISEANVLYKQGSLTEEDIMGITNFQDATGQISEGMEINLREVKIGSQVLYDVRALVVDNDQAPLLLGQSALEQFGSIEIDNKNDLIILGD